MSRESPYYDDQSKGGGGSLQKAAEIGAIGAGGVGLMAGPVKLASMTGKKVADDKKAADAKKRESEKPDKEIEYKTPEDVAEEKTRKKTESAYTKAMPEPYKKGGYTKSADGIASRGKTRGTMVMCGGGMTKRK
jgi:hypothetical protein